MHPDRPSAPTPAPRTSDVDLLVESLPEAGVSALESGRRVDLIEPSAVANPILREAFVRDRVPFHAVP